MRDFPRWILAFLLLIPTCATSKAAANYQEKVLYAFQGGSDGETPDAGLIRDADGNFYGTTLSGGGNTSCTGGSQVGCGTIYKLAPDGTETILYRFCGQTDCADGASPFAGLVMDAKGNLYGTTSTGGSSGRWGTVFEFTANGQEKVLYSFQDSVDGATPFAGLIRDKKSNLYGTARGGGTSGAGTIFMITLNGSETVLYSFCSQQNCTDGGAPWGGLTSDESGDLYGTTEGGGASQSCTFSGGCGVVFELPKGGSYEVLHSFGAGSDGANPLQETLLLDKAGNLFGTTGDGFGTGCGGEGCGTAFEISSAGSETVLRGFGGNNDGRVPDAGLISDGKGNLYGTTAFGGESGACAPPNMGCGTVFKISPEGAETVLYAFKAGRGGRWPQAPLIRDSAGNLYGTTSEGGSTACNIAFYGCGVVFEISR